MFRKIYRKTGAKEMRKFIFVVIAVLAVLILTGCSEPDSGVYAIGDTGPAGGYIFYVDEADAFSWNYLEAAPSDILPFLIWDSNISSDTGALSMIIGSGYTNTLEIISKLGIGNYAAFRCYDLTIGNYTDWFLPSEEELFLMYSNLSASGIGNFENYSYWSSTEHSPMFARNVSMDSGFKGMAGKTDANFVRAARSF